MSESSADPSSLSPAMIAALRARHIAFLLERLTDDRARGDFLRSFEAGYDHVLSQKIKEVFVPKTFVDQLAKVLSNETVRGLLSPIARDINRRALIAVRSDDATLGDYVPEDAREAINELLARPDLFPEALVRKIFDDEATEEIMRDMIYDALVEFNESVNPFFADWGLPALIKRFMPIGSGAVLKSMTAVRSEFDKRLEPEMRKFLLTFSRKSKKKLADILISTAGDPKMVGLRQGVVAFFYDEKLSALTKNVDDDARMNADEAVEGVVLEVLRHERPRERLLSALEDFVKEHGEESIESWLKRIGVTARPDFEALADLIWPFVQLAMKSPAAKAFFERITWDFYGSLVPAPTSSQKTE